MLQVGAKYFRRPRFSFYIAGLESCVSYATDYGECADITVCPMASGQ